MENKDKKVIMTMMVTIVILLVVTITWIIVNSIGLDISKESSLLEIANSVNNFNTESIESESLNDKAELYNNSVEEAQMITQNTNELIGRTAGDTDYISSRSAVDRQMDLYKEEEIHVNTSASQNLEYEELIQYTKIEDVKISFDMDVSKTTGLSKDDFVYLVNNMKYDKTGILARNAAWIWECCQKYGVNEIFVLGICGIESGWCSASQHQSTHNYSSLMSGGKLIPYASDEAGFEAMIKLLGQKYLTPGASLYHGATITGVGQCYCNPTSWPKKVYTCMQQALQ